jgi:hypothetical protein
VVQQERPHLTPKTRPPTNRDHTVIRFRHRLPQTGETAKSSAVPKHAPNIVYLLSLAKYESDGEEDDYRQRMLENGVAFAITIALIAAGVWLASNLHE